MAKVKRKVAVKAKTREIEKPSNDYWTFRLAGGKSIAFNLDLLDEAAEGAEPGQTVLSFGDGISYIIEFDFEDFQARVLQSEDCRKAPAPDPRPPLWVVTGANS